MERLRQYEEKARLEAAVVAAALVLRRIERDPDLTDTPEWYERWDSASTVLRKATDVLRDFYGEEVGE